MDLAVLSALEAELPGAGRRFACDFVGLWERRYAALAEAVAVGRMDNALDAVLSLKVSSAMVGARRLSGEAACVERALKGGSQVDLELFCGGLSECGRRTVRTLRGGFLSGLP
ncbi:Hpt domain-containing protein [Sinomonas sp. P47F7]|uniref:Hpt domain-containing protein n=1 Tax=Sinomonas sp. P47F7 TaxID=3410987 RepID=UPI003BF61E83